MGIKVDNNVEFYFGSDVGDDLYKTMDGARRSIFILTPYISCGYIDFLLRKNSENIDVTLVTTTDAQKNGIGEMCRKVLTQHRHTDDLKLKKKKRIKRILLILMLLTVLLCIGHLAWFMNYYIIPWERDMDHYLKFYNEFIPIPIAILVTSFFLYLKASSMRVLNYSYSTKFNFAVVNSPYASEGNRKENRLIHAKAYIVDGKYVFLGSMNFTWSGFRRNIESVVKIADEECADAMSQKIYNYLKYNTQAVDINRLGSMSFAEPAC